MPLSLQEELFAIESPEQRVNRLVELNVMEQVANVFKCGIVQRRRSETYKATGVAFPRIHGLVYAPGTSTTAVSVCHHHSFVRVFVRTVTGVGLTPSLLSETHHLSSS